MKWHGGPRPVTIQLFAASFVAYALLGLVTGLVDLQAAAMALSGWLGPLARSADAVIVALFTEFTIALIPVLWIYGLASRVARWIVTVFALYKLLGYRSLALTAFVETPQPTAYLEPALIVFALAMLFTPSAGAYLNAPRQAAGRETDA